VGQHPTLAANLMATTAAVDQWDRERTNTQLFYGAYCTLCELLLFLTLIFVALFSYPHFSLQNFLIAQFSVAILSTALSSVARFYLLLYMYIYK